MLQNKLHFLSCLTIAGLALNACDGEAPTGAREPDEPALRNVIVLLPDTLRADHVGTYGYERDTTPTIDALGAQGVVFEQAVSQASCTFPSANSILTSRYPLTFLRRRTGEMGIPPDIPTIAQLLSARGYVTVAISASPIVRKTPTRFNLQGAFDAGFDVFDESCLWGDASCIHGMALEELEERANSRRPFFLYLHYMDPHYPYRRPSSLPGRFAQAYRGHHEFIAEGDPNPIGEMLYADGPELDITEGDIRHLVDLYDEGIAFMDRQLGVFLAELESRGLLEDTYLAVVSDHGEEFLEHGHIKHCRTTYDTEIRTPLLLVGPEIEGGRRVSQVVENLDLVPTLLDYLGLTEPDTAFDGVSLRPLIEGREPDGDRASGPEAGGVAPPLGGLDGRGFTWQTRRRTLTEERFKLVFHLGNRWELFDRREDPAETRNVLADHRRTYARMRDDLMAWIQQVEPERFIQGSAVGEDFEERLRSLGYLN